MFLREFGVYDMIKYQINIVVLILYFYIIFYSRQEVRRENHPINVFTLSISDPEEI